MLLIMLHAAFTQRDHIVVLYSLRFIVIRDSTQLDWRAGSLSIECVDVLTVSLVEI